MISPEQILIGIDLGGTNVRVGSVTPAGESKVYLDEAIEAARGPQVGLGKITRLIEEVLRQSGNPPLAGIGIGSTGPIDRERGAIQNPYTLPTWEDVDIVHPLQDRFGVPVTLENDADVAAMGEAWVGAGQGKKRLALVTVGTGIGTALIVDGRIYRGIKGMHGEAGHHLLDPNGPLCYCGGRGCWESLAAGPAIGLRARAAVQRQVENGQDSGMLALAGGRLEAVDGMIAAQAARQGDPAARTVMDETAYYLGLGLVNVILFYLPDCIVLSGGVIRSFDLLEPGIRAVLARHDKMTPNVQVPLVHSKLGSLTGVLGAAGAILKVLEETEL